MCRFESQVQQWDVENDMVVLAKEMCMMVMDMSDFTRYIIMRVILQQYVSSNNNNSG